MPGFLPLSRASFMMDFVASAMLLMTPMLIWAFYIVRVQKNYRLHMRVMLGIGALLGLTVLLFEIDVRLNGWLHLAKPSHYYHTLLFPVLYVHLFFAISTSLLWIATLTGALRRYSRPPRPNFYSSHHKLLGKLTILFTIFTTCTGWTFYYLAFVA